MYMYVYIKVELYEDQFAKPETQWHCPPCRKESLLVLQVARDVLLASDTFFQKALMVDGV